LIDSSAELEARLNLRVEQLESDLAAKETEATSLRQKVADLREKLDAIVAEDEGKMSIEEHVQQLQDLKRMVSEMKEKHSSEKSELVTSQESAVAEIASLQTQLSSLVKESEAEVEQKAEALAEVEKLNRKLKKRMSALARKLAATTNLQSETELRLEDVCVALEKCQNDNRVLTAFIETESEERNRVLDGVVRRSADIGHLEEKLLTYRNKVGDKLVSNASKMQKLDLTYTQHRIEYRNRIKQLMEVIEKKDKQLLKFASATRAAGVTDDDDDVNIADWDVTPG